MLGTGLSSKGLEDAGNASVLRIGRLLRLTRMARMARVLRSMPELLILTKALLAAMRSVILTLVLLVIILYVFGIAFRMATDGHEAGMLYFSSVPDAMYILLCYGVLSQDYAKDVADLLGKQHVLLSAMYFLFVLLSALTVMNMLIGILCEVVSATAAMEKETLTVTLARSKLACVMGELDADLDGVISRYEFGRLLQSREACKALHDVGVDVVDLVDIADLLFTDRSDTQNAERMLDFNDFLDIVLQLRGSNTATVKNIVDLRKLIRTTVEEATGTLVDSFHSMRDGVRPLDSQTQISVHCDTSLDPGIDNAAVPIEECIEVWNESDAPAFDSEAFEPTPNSDRLSPTTESDYPEMPTPRSKREDARSSNILRSRGSISTRCVSDKRKSDYGANTSLRKSLVAERTPSRTSELGGTSTSLSGAMGCKVQISNL